jgi:uncharacterized protein
MTKSTDEPLPRRGYLGFAVDARPAPAELRHEGPERWIVSEIQPPEHDEPRDEALGRKLKLGDDVLAINGERIISLAHLRTKAAAVAAGSTCTIKVLREGAALDVNLASRPMPLEMLSAGVVELDHVLWSTGNEVVRLRAIWTRPAQLPTRAVVWLLPSAAWITQESPLDPLDPTFQLIDSLSSNGAATLRIDRAGLGDSEGTHASQLDFKAEMSMWEAGRRYFIERTCGTRRCLFGRSLGGILAPLVARGQAIDAICVWGTSSLNWHEASLESVEHQRSLRGASGDTLIETLRGVEQLQRLVYLDGLSPAAARRLHPELEAVAAEEYCGELVYDRIHTFFNQLQKADLNGAWQDFRAELLAVHAEYDIVVPERALRRLVKEASGPSRFISVPGVDHFMHERSSIDDAVRHPWGGEFSSRSAQLLCDFFCPAAPLTPTDVNNSVSDT